MNHENTFEVVSVSPSQMTPLILAVESETEYLAARVAYFRLRP